MNEDVKRIISALNPQASLEEEQKDVLAESPAVQPDIDMPTVATPQPEEVEAPAPDAQTTPEDTTGAEAAQTPTNVPYTSTDPDVITMENPNYIGSNEKYRDVIPYKINIFGEDITTKTMDPHKLAYELATEYNGRPKEDFFGYYYAPALKETWASAATKGAMNVIFGIPSGIAAPLKIYSDIEEDVLEQVLNAAGVINIPEDKLEKRLYNLRKYKDRGNVLDKLSNWLNTSFGSDQFLDDSLSTKISAGVGSFFGSVGASILAGGAGPAMGAVLNADVYENVRKTLEDKGHSALYSTLSGAGAWGAVSALDMLGLSRVLRMFRQVSKDTAKAALQNTTAKAARGRLTEKSMDELVKKATRTEDQVFWKGLTRGVTTTIAETGTEEGQKVVEDLFSENIGKGYLEENFDEFLTIGAVSLIGVGVMIPLEIRKTAVEHKFAKKAVGGYAGDLLKLKQARTQFYDKLIAAGWDENTANAYLDDLIVNGVDHAKALVSDAMLSLVASTDIENVKAIQERLQNANLEDISKKKFKELDDRVVAALENVEGLSESDKLLIRAGYQGIANWMAYLGVGPESITVPTFTTDIDFAEVDANVAGAFSPERNIFYVRREVTPDEAKYMESILKKEDPDVLDEAAMDRLLKKLQRKFGKRRGEVLHGVMLQQFANLQSSSPYDQFVIPEGLIDEGISKRAKTILHELAHNLDWKVLKAMGIKEKQLREFLDSYLDVIERVFGQENRDWVDTMMHDPIFGLDSASTEVVYDDNGLVDFGTAAIAEEAEREATENYAAENRGFFGFRTRTGEDAYTSPRNSTEWFAQAMGRLAREAAKGLGLRGNPALFVQLANSILEAQDNMGLLSQPYMEYLDAFKKLVADNSALVKAMAKKYGPEKLNGFMQRLADGDGAVDGISLDEIKSLLTMAESYVDSEAGQQLGNIFQNVSIPKVVDAVDGLEMFNRALDMSKEGDTTNMFADTKVSADGSIALASTSVPAIQASLEILTNVEKKENKTLFQRQTETKVNGKTLEEDIESAASLVKSQQDNTLWGRFYKWMIGRGRFGISEIVRYIGGKELEDRLNLIQKHNDFDDAVYNRHNKFTNRVQKEVLGKDKNTEANLSKGLQAFELDCAIKRHEVDFKDPGDGVVEKRKISTFELMSIYLVSRQDKRNVVDGVEVGVTPKERLQMSLPNQKIDDLVKLLTPEQKKYADIMQEEMGDAFDSFIQTFEDAGLGTNFAKIDNYWPLMDSLHQHEGQEVTNITVARDMFTDSPLGITDARDQFNRYMTRVASAESGFYTTIHRLKDMFFYNPNLEGSTTKEDRIKAAHLDKMSRAALSAMKRRLGADGVKNFQELLKDFMSPTSQNLLSNSLVSKISRNMTSEMLSWKPIQFVKASANFFSHWGLAEDQGQYWSDTVAGIMNAKQTWETMLKYSPEIRRRLRGMGYSEFLNSTTAGGDNILAVLAKEGADRNAKWFKEGAPAISNFIALSNVMKRAGLSPMLFGDAFSNVYGGYGLFMQFVKKFNGDYEAAGKAFDETIVRRQASSNQAMKSLTQRQWNRSIAGAFLAFTSEGINKWNDMLITIQRAHEGETSSKEAIKSITSNLSSVIVFSLINMGIVDLLFGDEEEKEKAKEGALNELVSQVAGVSLLGNAIVAPAINTLLGDKSANVSVPVATELLSYTRSISKKDWGDVLARSGSMAGFFVGNENLLNSFRGVKRASEATNEKEYRAGVAQAGGRSEPWANKREGIKKTVERKDGKQ